MADSASAPSGEASTGGPRPIRLGFPVKVMGAHLPSHDSRRWQNRPHLSVSLAYLRDIFGYLAGQQIHFYRMAGQLAPYLTHPGLPDFHRQLEECDRELADIGDLARGHSLRLTLHPGFYIQLGSPDPERVKRSVQEIIAAADLLGRMGLGGESVMVIHVGGQHGDAPASLARFVEQVNRLPDSLRDRLALENDDRLFSFTDLLWVQRRTGLRLVLDVLHHRCHNPARLPVDEALRLALATWPQGQRPKIHMSSSRTEVRLLRRAGGLRAQPPLPNQHSDFINPFEMIEILQQVSRLGLRPFDIMLEAKAKDVALLRLRAQIAHFAPELAPLVG